MHLQASKMRKPKNYDMPTEESSPNPRPSIVPFREEGIPHSVCLVLFCVEIYVLLAHLKVFLVRLIEGGGLDMLEHFVIVLPQNSFKLIVHCSSV